MMGLNMDFCILCKRCLISIVQSILLILLYVDPKKYRGFFCIWRERERGNKSKQLLELFYLYFCIS